MQIGFELTGLRADKPRPRMSIPSYRGARRRIRARRTLKTMQYNNFCLTLNSRARAARACFLRQSSQKMQSSFELTGLRADKPRPRRSIPSAVLPRGKATYPRKTGAQNHAQAARARQTQSCEVRELHFTNAANRQQWESRCKSVATAITVIGASRKSENLPHSFSETVFGQ